MGKLTFTPFQKLVFDEFSRVEKLRKQFYFGGGTALSVFYLQHRYSDDLDYLSEIEFDKNTVIEFVNHLSKKLSITIKITKKKTVLWFELRKDNQLLKIDFITFPYPRIEKGDIYQGVVIDSAQDIAANKLLVMNLETNPKDYVDMYFLLKEKFTIWDIIYTVEAKFKLRLDLIALGSDFLEAEKLEFLPRMHKPLDLGELKKFFRQKAIELGSRAVK